MSMYAKINGIEKQVKVIKWLGNNKAVAKCGNNTVVCKPYKKGLQIPDLVEIQPMQQTKHLKSIQNVTIKKFKNGNINIKLTKNATMSQLENALTKNDIGIAFSGVYLYDTTKEISYNLTGVVDLHKKTPLEALYNYILDNKGTIKLIANK